MNHLFSFNTQLNDVLFFSLMYYLAVINLYLIIFL